MHRLVFRLKLISSRFDAIADGIPFVLLKNYQWQVSIMDKTRVQDTDVMASARANDVPKLDEIKYAGLERYGGISIINKTE